MKTLLIDNYDSFSHILFQYLWEVNGEKPIFIHNDEWTLEQVRAARFDNIVVSPGPGHPGNARDFGICADVIREIGKPILGVCLGLQGLGLGAGVPVVSAPAVRHGKPSRIIHDGRDLFAGLPQGFDAVRYHSLVLERAVKVPGLSVSATSEDDGQVMAIRIEGRPVFGVQFHPESIGTEHGKALLANFRDLSAAWLGIHDPAYATRRAGPGETLSRHAQGDSTALVPTFAPAREKAPVAAAARLLSSRELPWRDPEAVFERFFKDRPATFWLDSLTEPVPGEPRVTYMGTGRRMIEVRDGGINVCAEAKEGGFRVEESAQGDPFAWLDAYLRGIVPCRLPDSPAFSGSFRGGLVGWFGYELKRFTGGRDAPGTPEAGLPDAAFLEPDRILAFDAGARKVHAFLPLGREDVPTAEATAWLDALQDGWEFPAAPEPRLRRAPAGSAVPAPLRLPWRLSASKPEYLGRIRSLQEAILRGDTYEACLTNELSAESGADPFLAYRMLRRTNPAPYAAYLRFPQGTILSASPERFLKLDALGNLASRPIKGTRPRGATASEDAALKADLAGNAKDRSENLMIVDLVRNDFGKVCALGSVRVPELMKVEEHPTVLQLVSTVVGRLEEGKGAMDAVRACFPGGSMTGAPKIRTMELLEAEERRPRGVFSGAMGYLGWDGTMDLGMVIRTLVHKDGRYSVGCGGAILAESDPEAEFAEAMLKASASLVAVELAEFGAAGGWNSGI